MTLHEFPRLGERYWEQRLENGLLLRVVPKPGFARSYAFLGVDYGSVDTSFTRGGIPCRTCGIGSPWRADRHRHPVSADDSC